MRVGSSSSAAASLGEETGFETRRGTRSVGDPGNEEDRFAVASDVLRSEEARPDPRFDCRVEAGNISCVPGSGMPR